MKILRIQFENLNSLPSGDIDFTAPPLAEAGLFAITGPTGAGKSTILDAITLALYGRAARYSNTPNPEDMMSRRAGSCLSEVTFEIRGEIYRARWQLRRARGKADGKIQPPQRHLYSHSGEVLAQGVNEVVRRVEEITGLSYDRFLRSVLLAQGQFARFLMAKESERAQLLESLTGTEIYGDLGEFALQEVKQREEQLNRRADLLNAATFLTPEEHAGKTASLQQKTEALEGLKAQRDAARLHLERGQQLQTHLQSEARLAAESDALAQESERLAPERERLAQHRAGEPYHRALQSLDGLIAQEATQACTFASTAEAADRATRSAATAQAALATLYRREADLAGQTLQRLAREKDARATRSATLTKEIARESPALETALPSLLSRLTRLDHLRTSLARQQEQGAALAEKAAEAGRQKAELEKELTAESAQLQTLTEQLQAATRTAETLREGRSEAQLLEKTRKLDERHERLLELRDIMARHGEAKRKSTELADAEGQIKEEIEEIKRQLVELEREAATQARLLQQAEQSHARLRQVAGFEAQRAELEPGVPCPLCGSKEHPDAHRAILSAEIEDALQRIETARNANDTAAKEAELARIHLTQRKADFAAHRRNSADLRTQQNADHERFTTLARPLRVYTPESLEEKRESHKKERREWEERLVAIREADRQKAAAGLAHAEGKSRVNTLTARLNALTATLHDLQSRLEALDTEERDGQSELSTLATSLTDELQPLSLSLPPPGEEAALRKTLEDRLSTYRVLKEEQTALAQAETKAAGESVLVESTRAKAQEEARRLSESGDLSPVNEQEIADCLAGWSGIEAGRTHYETLRTESTALASRHKEQQEQLTALRLRLAEEERALVEKLASSPFATINALREARLEPEEQQAVLQKLEQIKERAQTISGRREQLRAQILELRELKAPEADTLPLAVDAAAETEKNLLAATEERATLERELREHDARAAAHREALEALQRDREQLGGWLRLRTLIGGVAFRKFAQGLTLDVLLRHANEHLSRLTDRYRLQRAAGGELELEITDLHQAGAVRPAASLSGGESFLASLALALGLSDLAGRNIRIDSLFIDEGFGTLDPETLDIALSALDTLRLSQKMIGVISHVDLLKERINVQIVVEKGAGGMSRLRLRSG